MIDAICGDGEKTNLMVLAIIAIVIAVLMVGGCAGAGCGGCCDVKGASAEKAR